MDIYGNAWMLRNRYANDIDYEVKVSIINQILSATFKNKDLIPKIVTVKIDCKPILKMNRPWTDSHTCNCYPLEVLFHVLANLGIGDYNINYFRRCSAFSYLIEINFSHRVIESR